MLYKLKEDKRGSLLWELLVVLAVLFVFLYSAVSFLGIFSQYETMTYATKTAARQIEITGLYNSDTVNSNIAALLENANLTVDAIIVSPGVMPMENTSNDLAASLMVNQKLQLGQKFTFTVIATYDWHIAGGTGSLFSDLTVPITMSYRVTGMSEVFWRN